MGNFIEELFRLEGKVCALTGAAGFLVSEMSRGLSRAGVKVALLDKDQKAAQRVSDEISAGGGEAMALELDCTRKGDYQRTLGGILEKFGRLDYAVFGAGMNAPTPFLDISAEEWHAIMDVQLTGTMLGLQVFGAHMLEQARGAMVTISSASAGPPLSKAFTYSVAKAGVKNLTQDLARA